MTISRPLPRRVHRRTRGYGPAAFLATLLASVVTTTGAAQLIEIRTVRIAQADQFAIFPSFNLGMGGVSIALPDTFLDLAANPARGARIPGARLFGAPALYSVSQDAGGGGALPVGAVARWGAWFGGVSLALQVVEPAGPDQGAGLPPIAFVAESPTPILVPPSAKDAHGNALAFAALGRTWPGLGLSVGGSASWARLRAVHAVDLLYGNSYDLRQWGHTADARIGALKQWANGQSLEALILRHRFRMSHDVTFLDWFWDPAAQRPTAQPRLESNLHHTDTWGLHLAYERPLTPTGWRIGAIATANRVSQSKMPDFRIASPGVLTVPWDPGTSYAFNAGVGLSRTHGPARFGFDVVYEPIWSHTWRTADAPVATRTGDTIPAGGPTTDNRFEFSNVLLRMGVGREVAMGSRGHVAALQFGLVVRSIHYWLAQYDNVQRAGRNHEEQWMEWTPTWGASLRSPQFEVRYHGRATNGTGRPGAFGGGGFLVADLGAPVPPGPTPAPPSLADVLVITHQVSFVLPLGRRPPGQGGVP